MSLEFDIACLRAPHDIDNKFDMAQLISRSNMAADQIEELENKRVKLEQFLADDIKDALVDLLNYIDNAGWTRHQQAEHDDCARMIARLDELLK